MGRRAAALLGALLLWSAAAPADSDYNRARELVESGKILPLSQVLQRLPPGLAGRVLEVELEEHAGTVAYEIELLDKAGEVHKLHLDARTGKPLGEGGK